MLLLLLLMMMITFLMLVIVWWNGADVDQAQISCLGLRHHL